MTNAVLDKTSARFIAPADAAQAEAAATAACVPFRRIGKPQEVADAIVFFAGKRSDYVTGQVLSVSGGLTMAG